MKKFFFILTLLFTATIVSAQKYHDAAAFGLNGHVKECIVADSNTDPYGFKYVSFKKDGSLDSLDFIGDYITNINRSNGYITDYVEKHIVKLLLFSVFEYKKTFQYKNNRLFRTLLFDDEDDKMPRVTTYEYGEKGLKYREEGCINISDIKDKIDRGQYIFDDLLFTSEYDIYGTWYNVKNLDKYGNYTTIEEYWYNIEKKDYECKSTIKRKISYWDNSSSSNSSSSTGWSSRHSSTTSSATISNSEDKQIFTVNGVSFTMVRVEGGTFMMGATEEQGSDAEDNEKPAHQVTLSTYSIGETEVTQELWQAVMGSNPSKYKGNKRPVERVRWYDCQDFIRKLNAATGKTFRLPTEAEWEYAARGGNRSRGYKYAGSNDIESVAWYRENSYNKGESIPDYIPHEVGTKLSNELGLYDMSGNVSEWCQDWNGSYSSRSQTNPKGPESGEHRQTRGGNHVSHTGDCRVSNREAIWPSIHNYNLGLRLVLSE